MKQLARYFLLFTIFICCAVVNQAQEGKPLPGEIVTSRPLPEYDPKSWKEFSSPEGRFTILLPGTPVKSVRTYDSPFGKLVEHAFSLSTNAFYIAMYTDYPETDGIRDVEAFFNGFREGNLRALKGQLLEDKKDYRFASPGRFIKMRIEGGYVSRVRLHMIRNRAYVVFVVMPEKDASAETLKFYEETAMKVLDSFKPKIDEKLERYDRFGDPRPVRPPLLPLGGINIDPVLTKNPQPEPDAKINGGVLNGKALSLPQPAYPPEAKAAGASGEVEVKIVVDESGKVIWARALSGHLSLKKAAEDAAYQARFQPMTVESKPEKVAGFLIYKFVQ